MASCKYCINHYPGNDPWNTFIKFKETRDGQTIIITHYIYIVYIIFEGCPYLTLEIPNYELDKAFQLVI